MRPILDEKHIHSAIRDRISHHHESLLDEVRSAIDTHDVVVVGMSQNPFPRKACKALRGKGVAFEYLEYGSYLSTWRPRTALKMWTGWPTFPMIFVKGLFIGGYDDMQKLLDGGEFDKLLEAPRS